MTLGARQRWLLERWPAIRAVAISGLLYALAELVVAPGVDFRYAHWIVTAGTIGIVTTLIARRATWRTEAA